MTLVAADQIIMMRVLWFY